MCLDCLWWEPTQTPRRRLLYGGHVVWKVHCDEMNCCSSQHDLKCDAELSEGEEVEAASWDGSDVEWWTFTCDEIGDVALACWMTRGRWKWRWDIVAGQPTENYFLFHLQCFYRLEIRRSLAFGDFLKNLSLWLCETIAHCDAIISSIDIQLKNFMIDCPVSIEKNLFKIRWSEKLMRFRYDLIPIPSYSSQ